MGSYLLPVESQNKKLSIIEQSVILSDSEGSLVPKVKGFFVSLRMTIKKLFGHWLL